MIVDTHVHIWEVPPIAPVGPTGPRQAGVLTESAPAELLVEDIDAHGVDWAVIVQTSSSTWDNGYIADSARKHPDRFIAHGMVDPLDPDNATTAADRDNSESGEQHQHQEYHRQDDDGDAREAAAAETEEGEGKGGADGKIGTSKNSFQEIMLTDKAQIFGH